MAKHASTSSAFLAGDTVCFKLFDQSPHAEPYRQIWEQRLDRLDHYLQELQTKEKSHARKPRRK